MSSLRPAAVFGWVLIQIGALSTGALRAPLWPHHPMPRESLAVQEMIAVQIIASSLLFPILLPNAITSLVAIALAWPFFQLAGLLSSTPPASLLGGSFYLSVWMLGLGCWARLLKSPENSLIGVTITAVAALGGPIFFYLRLEAVESGGASFHADRYGPLLGAVSQLTGEGSGPIAWIEVGLPLLLAGFWSVMRWFWKRRIFQSTSPHRAPD